jgi:3-oxoacyl-[acyl-carrier protein] reductase
VELGIKGRLAVVTGASQGIGRAIALSLANEGARLAVVARRKEKLDALLAELPKVAGGHMAVAADLMTPQGLSETVTKLAPLAPEIVVHNLGGSLGMQDANAPAAEYEKVWRYNVGIPVELNRAFVPSMVKKRWGRVVHLSTLSTTTYNGSPAYVSAKCALDGYVNAYGRVTAKDNVVFSAVAPGAIYTEGRFFAKLEKENPAQLQAYFKEHLPAGRLGRAEDIGPVVAFLCSDFASFMTGSIVGINGGGM